jgi:GNAT superfamily N-acetyltransferase
MDAIIRDFTPRDYPAVAAVQNAATPRDPTSVEHLQQRDEYKPEAIRRERWVAERDGSVVGVGGYTQSSDLYHPQKFQLIICVHPGYRRQGIGSRLYDHLVRELQRFGPIAFQARAYEDDSSTLDFLAHRGFVEDFRQWESHLSVAGFDLERWQVLENRVRAQGITIATLADLTADVDRDRRLYDLEIEVDADVPSPDSVRNSLWPRDENRFRRYSDLVLHDPDRPPWTYLVAIKDGEYIGLSYGEADPENGIFDIDMTGVSRGYRGMGVATALNVHSITGARAQGYTTIRTWNDTANIPILRLNTKLGFVRQPSLIFFETPPLREKQ